MAMTYNEDGTVKKTKGNKKATPFKDFKDDAVKTPLRLIEVIKRLKEKKELDFSKLSDVELVAIVSKIAHPFKMLTEVERVAKGQVSKDNMDQTTSVEDEFIKRIGQDQESAELATRLLSKIKDSN
jgi:hypothetical protein